jgi:pyruvate ferredoxin oxidoreductase alpha subunit
MLIRDSGVIQLFAENAQEAYDLTVIAPRLSEHPDVLLPVLVCLDGFTITHSAEPVIALEDDAVREFVGEYRIPHALLDLERVTTQGPFAMPDYYFELRRGQYAELTGRSYGPFDAYRLDDADHALVCLGSSAGTAKDVVDELRAEGEAVGVLKLCSFRPFPAEAIQAVLEHVPSVSVLDRADSPGGAPPLFAEVTVALAGGPHRVSSYVYGLGGRDLHPADIRAILDGTAPHYVGVRSTACPV